MESLPRAAPSIRWGLCCQILDAPIRFRAATHAYVARLTPPDRQAYLDAIALHNSAAVNAALEYCVTVGIGAFRIVSQLFPLATHPVSGYSLHDLPSGNEVHQRLTAARDLARERGIRLSFHPDQFIVLNSVRPEVVDSAIQELEWQAGLAEILGADVICLHGGSTTGGFDLAIDRMLQGIARLSPRARERLALENDDRCFPLVELLPVSLATGVPLVLDAHHHRIMPGGLSLEEATAWAVATWNEREPYFHISSPRHGWQAGDPRHHAEFVDVADVPASWLQLPRTVTVDVEAKAKERAVLALRHAVAQPQAPAPEPGAMSARDALQARHL